VERRWLRERANGYFLAVGPLRSQAQPIVGYDAPQRTHTNEGPLARAFVLLQKAGLLLGVFRGLVGLVRDVLSGIGGLLRGGRSGVGSLGGGFSSGSPGGVCSLVDGRTGFGSSFAGGGSGGFSAFLGGLSGGLSRVAGSIASLIGGGLGFSGFVLGRRGFVLARRQGKDSSGKEHDELGVHGRSPKRLLKMTVSVQKQDQLQRQRQCVQRSGKIGFHRH
jgi:hypothetical protein